VQAFG